MRYIPIIPSSLQQVSDGSDFNSYNKVFSDYTLKVGVVTKKYEIDDVNNVSKAFPEYDVLAISQEKSLATSSVLYKKCQIMQGFGGLGDFMEYKLREPEQDPKNSQNDTDPREENGSIVLLLCMHGHQDNAVILGALQHPKRKTKLGADSGQALEGEFNGVSWQINDDGELRITYKSKTNNDGKPQDTEAGGTFVTITKDGSFDINTGNDSEYIRIDKPNKDVGINAGNKMGITAKDAIGFNAGANLNLNAGADWKVDASASATIAVGSSFDIESGSGVTVKSPMVEVTGESMLKLKSAMVDISGDLVLVGGPGGTPALILTTQFLGVSPFLGLPVTTQAIGPFSSKVFIAP